MWICLSGFLFHRKLRPVKQKASGRAHIVRGTMALRRPKRSVDCAARREESATAACSRAEQKLCCQSSGSRGVRSTLLFSQKIASCETKSLRQDGVSKKYLKIYEKRIYI